jgi:serine/threonine protein kinase
VYSFGMCVLQALSGAFPWGSTADQTVIWEVTQGHLPSRPAVFSSLQWDFVQRMCRFKPADRLQVDQVVKVLGFFAQRDPYVNDQSIRETLVKWERDPLPVQTPSQP